MARDNAMFHQPAEPSGGAGMSGAVEPYDPGLPDLHSDSGQWSHEDFVAAWLANESRATWGRAFLAAAYEGAHGDLQRYADAVGASYQTFKNYRAVVKAYAGLKSTDVGTFPFGVADALRGQEDRLELVSRDRPWSVEEARALVASRRGHPGKVIQGKAEPGQPAGTGAQTADPGTDPHADLRRGLDGGNPGKPAPARETGQPVSPSVTDTGDDPCPRCAPRIARLRSLLAGQQDELKKAVAEIGRLQEIRPDTVMAAELEAVAEGRDRLAARVRELEERLSGGPGGAERAAPPTAPQTRQQAAGGAHGSPQAPPERQCGRTWAGKALVTLPDGREWEKWLCREHAAQLAGTGCTVSFAEDGDPLSFEADVGRCQYRARAEAA